MKSEPGERAGQKESDYQRWADDGGFIPEAEAPGGSAPARFPWRVIGMAAAVGFAIGWLTSPGSRGGR